MRLAKRPPYLSVSIPTYEMNGLGTKFLKQSLNILAAQSYSDFEVVISDYSVDHQIEKLVSSFEQRLNIRYFRNPDQHLPPQARMSANTNRALSLAQGKLIKLLFQDDYLFGNDALQKTVAAFNLKTDNWLVSACTHSQDGKTTFKDFFPHFNKLIFIGLNTISSPSVLTLKNQGHLKFDPQLVRLMDCDYYYRCFSKFGAPRILNSITVVNRIGQHQLSNSANSGQNRSRELDLVLTKHVSSKLLLHGLMRRILKWYANWI